MKITPKNDFLLLEAYTMPREEGKIILSCATKDTQVYKVIDGFMENGQLIYLKCQPRMITLGDKVFYMAQEEDVMATVEV
jgi:hypothetical protein